jgi:hypothetical protein
MPTTMFSDPRRQFPPPSRHDHRPIPPHTWRRRCAISAGPLPVLLRTRATRGRAWRPAPPRKAAPPGLGGTHGRKMRAHHTMCPAPGGRPAKPWYATPGGRARRKGRRSAGAEPKALAGGRFKPLSRLHSQVRGRGDRPHCDQCARCEHLAAAARVAGHPRRAGERSRTRGRCAAPRG